MWSLRKILGTSWKAKKNFNEIVLQAANTSRSFINYRTHNYQVTFLGGLCDVKRETGKSRDKWSESKKTQQGKTAR